MLPGFLGLIVLGDPRPRQLACLPGRGHRQRPATRTATHAAERRADPRPVQGSSTRQPVVTREARSAWAWAASAHSGATPESALRRNSPARTDRRPSPACSRVADGEQRRARQCNEPLAASSPSSPAAPARRHCQLAHQAEGAPGSRASPRRCPGRSGRRRPHAPRPPVISRTGRQKSSLPVVDGELGTMRERQTAFLGAAAVPISPQAQRARPLANDQAGRRRRPPHATAQKSPGCSPPGWVRRLGTAPSGP